MPSIKFTDIGIKKLKTDRQVRYFERIDRGCSLCLSVTPSSKTWGVMLYDLEGHSKLHTLKSDDGRVARYPVVTLATARRLAMNAFVQPETVAPPPPPPTDLLGMIAQRYFDFIDNPKTPGGRRRTVADMRSCFNRYLGVWSHLPVAEIRKSMIVSLRNDIAVGRVVQPARGWRKAVTLRGGARTANAVLSLLRSILNFHAEGDDNYANPMPRSMLVEGGNKERERVLDDDEIAQLWAATAAGSPVDPIFAGMLRLALLSGSRIGKIRDMRWRDLDLASGVWTLGKEVRAKPNAGVLTLPALALAILAEMPRHPGGDLIFSVDGVHQFASFAQAKRKLDRVLQFETPFVVHDLRRTCRTLLARLDVSDTVAERILGHILGGKIARTYNRFTFEQEKAVALHKLADLVASITGGNVVQLVKAR